MLRHRLERVRCLLGAFFRIEPDRSDLHVKAVPVWGDEVDADRCWIRHRARLRLPTVRHLEPETSVAWNRKIRAFGRRRAPGGGGSTALQGSEQRLGSFSERDYDEDIAGFEHKLRMVRGWT